MWPVCVSVCICVYGVCVCMCLLPAQSMQGREPKPGSASQTLLSRTLKKGGSRRFKGGQLD